MILEAESALEEYPITSYSAVIVDEAQDLSCAMIRMLHSLVGDRPDGLTLVGEGLNETINPVLRKRTVVKTELTPAGVAEAEVE